MLDETKVARMKALGLMLDLDAELFAQGLSELRKYVLRERTRIVPLGWKTDSGLMLGKWVVEQRTRQRRNRLDARRQQLLKEAFFLWQPSEAPSFLFQHPEDRGAAEVTRGMETDLKSMRWLPIGERRRAFRQMVLKHHPDVWEDKHAGAAIQFLADVKDWFLGGH